MIRVLYDNQIFNVQRFGGISRYFTELITGLNSSKAATAIPGKYISENKHLQYSQLTHLDRFTNGFHFRGKKRIESYLKSRETESIYRELRKGNFDVFHPTYYNPNFLEYIQPNKPFVLTVHDMIHEIYYDHVMEQLSAETINKRLLIPKASHIIAVSQKTKDDIIAFFPELDPQNISVIYHGSSLSTTIGSSNIKLPSKYILYVGNRGWYKNFKWFLKATSQFLIENELTLVCAGGGHFSEYENDLLENYNVVEKVIYVEINSDDDLKVIYRNAIAMIFPSLYEGFGIPILEAYSSKCPVILMDTACFREVAGDAALYFGKDEKEVLLNHLKAIMTDKVLSEHLKELGKSRLKMYSWEKNVSQHIEIYKSFG